MTASTPITSQTTPPVELAPDPQPPVAKKWRPFRFPRIPKIAAPLWSGWLVVAVGLIFLGSQFVGIGLETRAGVWGWTAQAKSQAKAYQALNAAITRSKKIVENSAPFAADHPHWSEFRRTLHGMVKTYDDLAVKNTSNVNDDPDAPPIAMLMFTHWDRSELSTDKHLAQHVAEKVVGFNTICEAVSAALFFALVWIWMERRPLDPIPPRVRKWLRWPLKTEAAIPTAYTDDWRARWGDPLLLGPVVALGICVILRTMLTFTPSGLDTQPVGPMDERMVSISFWVFAVLRFLSAVCLARFLPRPWRAPACAFVAASLVWLNPALILADHGWPLWDVWAVPLFLAAALLVSLNCWQSAGIVLALGCLLRGQTIWAAPVLILCPILAGNPGKFLRILAGWGAVMAIGLWPWLVTNGGALVYIIVTVVLAGAVSIVAVFRPAVHAHIKSLTEPAEEKGWKKYHRYVPAASAVALLLAALIVLWIRAHRSGQPAIWTFILCLIVLGVPFLIPKRLLIAWMIFIFASATWLAGFHFAGDSSIWNVGYAFATTDYQKAAIRSNSLGNLEGVMEQKFSWKITDPLSDFHVPLTGTRVQWSLGETFTAIYLATALACAAGAAMQLRKGDPKFLIALAAPWMLAAALITPLPASFMILPAVLAAGLIGVSTGMSLWQLFCVVVGSVMILAQILPQLAGAAPATLGIVRPTSPDMGWMMPLAAAAFLYTALIPTRDGNLEVPAA